jgi:uncharacterized protein (DUF305 family)
MSGDATTGDAKFQQAMHAAMHAMEAAMATAPMTGDPDHDFLTMMIPHHEGAVEMARLVLLHGRDPLVRQLAEQIIAGQQAEIASMRGRLASLPPSGGRSREYPALGGTRGTPPKPDR